MNDKTLYNKLTFFLIALLYLSFYLFSPFFHYHHNDSIKERGKVDYHIHLSHDVEKKTNTTEYHHTIDQNDEHNHPVEINALVTNLPPRFVYSVNNTLLFSNIITFEFQTGTDEIKLIEDFHDAKTLKDKCIHSASNVSPPFILAA